MISLMTQQMKEFKRFIQKFSKADLEMEAVYERGEEPTAKQEKEFRNLQIEYSEFMEFFKLYNTEYWDGVTLLDVAERVISEYGGY